MKHEDITLPDETRDGNGRRLLWSALGLTIKDRAERMRVEKMLHETTVSQGHRAAYQREIEDAAALMKGIYPEDAAQVDRILSGYPWLELTEGREAAPHGHEERHEKVSEL